MLPEVRACGHVEATVFDGPIWMQVLRAKDFFEEVIQRSYTVREEGLLGHRMVYNWPETAFAELLTNAVLHKEYDKREYVGVYVYEDTLSFINHNRPLPPVTIEDMNTQEEFRDREYLNPELKEMFHALGLIESYGSGIRRAKHAMAENGNPPLLFEPLNDTDDYTMVTCPINEEYAYIRDHEDVATRKNLEMTTSNAQEIVPNTQDLTSKAQEQAFSAKGVIPNAQDVGTRILQAISENPTLGARELSARLDATYDTIRYWLRKLRGEKVIHHEGSTKAGYWVIDKEQHDG